MPHPPDLNGPLPDIYRSREAFFASLPAWRRFLAKLNWHPIIDLMVESYAREQEDARRRDRLARSESSPPDDALLAELNAELHRRGSTTITDLPAEPTDPHPERAKLSLPRFQGQCLESCFYTDPMRTNDHNECPVYASPLQR